MVVIAKIHGCFDGHGHEESMGTMLRRRGFLFDNFSVNQEQAGTTRHWQKYPLLEAPYELLQGARKKGKTRTKNGGGNVRGEWCDLSPFVSGAE
jgi:hypothetical protein